jgi:hypothetical protein
LHMIGRSKMNEKSHDMTPNGMCIVIETNMYNKHLISD